MVINVISFWKLTHSPVPTRLSQLFEILSYSVSLIELVVLSHLFGPDVCNDWRIPIGVVSVNTGTRSISYYSENDKQFGCGKICI